MPTENKPGIMQYLPWVGVAVLAYMLWQEKAPGPTPDPLFPSVEAVTKQVLPSVAKGFAAAFEDAATKVESKEIKTDRELLEFVKPLTTKARLEANKPFDVMLETSLPNGDFAGHEAEVAKLLRRIANSWK